VRGEPIVCTPEDAFECFIRTHMDTLVVGPFVLRKEDQRRYPEIKDARDLFPLD
jgi:carbamoyltransferase